MVDHVITKAITAADVAEREAHEEAAREIIGGEWAEESEMAGQKHALLSKRILRILDNFVVEYKLGEVYGDGTTYVLEGTPERIITQRVPDVSFVSEARVDRENTGLMYFAPDLAIEVLSPNERAGRTAGKVADYLRFGTQQVWVIDPEEQQVAVHTPDGRVKVYSIGDTLTSETLLPNFELKVSEVFS